MFFSNPYDMEAYGQLPSEQSMIVQMVSIFYIVFFYRTHSNELLYGVHSFFVDGYRIMLEKISAMFAAHFIFQGIMLIVTYSMFTMIYFVVGIEPSGFYLSLFRFLTIYMLAPMIFSMLYGLIIAMLFGTKKSSFFGILLVWIATGSMSKEVFFSFFRTVHANEWQSLLFIGTNNMMHVYKSYIGFDVQWGNELKLITWFLITTGIILILSLRWTLRTRERNFVIKALLAMSFLCLVTAYGVVDLSTKTFSLADQMTETDKYENMDEAETDIRYEIESYSISLEAKQATVQVTFSDMDTLEPTFQLYHAYPVKWIKAGDKLVEFERNGDFVKVHMPTKTSSLIFQYEVVDTNFIPHTNGKTLLLADKAWYPKKRASHMYVMNEDRGWIELSERFLPNESYSFTLKVEEALFSNLPKHGDVYSGESQAVTLINGQGNQLTFGDYHITYPADWPKMKERVPTVVSQLEKTLNDVQLLAPTTVQSLPTVIVFSNYGLSSLMTKDHLIFNTGYGVAVDAHDTTKDLQEIILQLAVQNKGLYTLHKEWVNMASQYIREKNEWVIDLKGRSSESYFLAKVEQESIDVIYHYFYGLNLEQQQHFLREWYKKMDETWTWNQVLDLVEE